MGSKPGKEGSEDRKYVRDSGKVLGSMKWGIRRSEL